MSNGRKPASSSCPAGYVPAGHIVPIRLSARQQNYCRRAIGIRRYVYNLCVATHAFCRINRLPWPSWQDLQKAINSAKKEEFPFVAEVSKFVAEGAAKDFGQAVQNWQHTNNRSRRPNFKKKRLTGTGAFLAASGVKTIKYDGKRRIKLPYLGSVKLAHTLPQGVYYEARISFRNGQWLLSFNYWKPPVKQPMPDNRIAAGGVDTGINPHATDSEGQTWENPKAYYQAEKKLRRWQRAQARRTVNSRGWWEAQRRINRLFRRINGLRNNAQHRMTTELVKKYQNLVIEDLHVAGMMRGKSPKAQADASIGEIKRQLIYKGQWHHCEITLADRFYPSSKTCSNCGCVNAKLKRERYWHCPSCGAEHERNENAAANLRSLLGETLTLPPGRESGSATGRLWPPDTAGGETIPNDRRTGTLAPPATQTVSR